jgi:hypothetical protein
MLHPHSRSLALAILAGSAFVVLPGLSPDSAGSLRANGGSYAVGLDTDGDGLHDALEVRLGTDHAAPDSDFDGIDDYEELILGEDPLTPTLLTEFQPEASLHLDVYSAGTDLVFQIAAYTQTSVVENVLVGWATPGTTGTATDRELAGYVIDSREFSAGHVGWRIKTVNLSVPLATVDQVPSMGIGITALVDNELCDSTIQLLHLDNILCQLRDDLVDFTGGNGGGVFPVEPGGQIPSGNPDEVCVQTLVPTAFLPGGKVEYQVTDADCESLPGAVCLPGCDGSVLDILIGIDILSLLN